MTIGSLNLKSTLEIIDYIPFVSTAFSLYHIFHRALFYPKENCNYSLYLAEKDFKVLILGLIPFANILGQIYHNFFSAHYTAFKKVKHHASLFAEAPQESKDDIYLVYYAISQRFYAIQWASPRLKNQEWLAKYAVSKDGDAYYYLPDNLKNKKHLARLACLNKGGVYAYLQDTFKNDHDIIKAALFHDGGIIQLVPEPHKSDRTLNMLALKKYADVFPYIADQYKEDDEFILEAISFQPGIYPYLSEKYNTECYKQKFLDVNPKILDFLLRGENIS